MNHILDRFLWQTYFGHAVTTGGKRRQHCTSVSQHSRGGVGQRRVAWSVIREHDWPGSVRFERQRHRLHQHGCALPFSTLDRSRCSHCGHSYQKDTRKSELIEAILTTFSKRHVRSLLSGELCLRLHCSLNMMNSKEMMRHIEKHCF